MKTKTVCDRQLSSNSYNSLRFILVRSVWCARCIPFVAVSLFARKTTLLSLLFCSTHTDSTEKSKRFFFFEWCWTLLKFSSPIFTILAFFRFYFALFGAIKSYAQRSFFLTNRSFGIYICNKCNV